MSAAISNAPISPVTAAIPGSRQLSQSRHAAEEVPSFFQALGIKREERRLRDMPGDMIADVLAAADPGQVDRSMNRFRTAATEEGARQVTASVEKPLQSFEAFLLRTSVESLLPGKDGEFYGKGPAAGIWRSMAADQFASLFAERGGIGIASSLEARLGTVAVNSLQDQQWPYFLSEGIRSYDPPGVRGPA